MKRGNLWELNHLFNQYNHAACNITNKYTIIGKEINNAIHHLLMLSRTRYIIGGQCGYERRGGPGRGGGYVAHPS